MIASQPHRQEDMPQPVTVRPLTPSENRQHQDITRRRPAHRDLGFAVLPNEEPTPPEQRLFQAVIVQALVDATTEPNGTTKADKEWNRHRARQWFKVNGPDFRKVCHLAGFDPATVLRKALRHIEGHDANTPGTNATRNPTGRRRRNIGTRPPRPRSPFVAAMLNSTALTPVRPQQRERMI